MSITIRKSTFLRVASAFVASLSTSLLCLAQQPAEPVKITVGEVSLVIGSAEVVKSGNQAVRLNKGAHIHVGDQIITDSGGHVHIQFIDGARVSVRPMSRLHIEDYTGSSDAKKAVSIKFKLEKGGIRSITGAWGQADRDRFRLNTPLAAIGIKGTDFIVKVHQDKVFATVVTGAIVLSPMTDQCVQTLGACVNGRERLLTDAMKNQMLEFHKGHATPVIVPAVDLMVKGGYQPMLGVKQAVTSSNVEAGVDLVDKSPQNAVIESTVTKQVISPVSSNPTLSWIRYPWVKSLNGDEFMLSPEEVLKTGYSSITGNGAYGLFQYNPSNQIFNVQDVAASFQLTHAFAKLYQPQSFTHELVTVGQGNLIVDFSKASYITQLQIFSPSIGNTSVSSTGSINSLGALRGTGGNAYVAGGFGADGKSAGYFFERAYPQGFLSGVTLWGR